MPQSLPELQNLKDDSISIIAHQEVDYSRYFVINKIVFWMVIVLSFIGISMALYILIQTNNHQSDRIKKDDMIIAQMLDSVKMRNAHIVSLEKDRKVQEAIIKMSQDSIAKAYKIINKIKINQNGLYKKHVSDSLAIEYSNIRGKVEFITGKH